MILPYESDTCITYSLTSITSSGNLLSSIELGEKNYCKSSLPPPNMKEDEKK